MILLLELIYAEIHNLAENISYLKGRCDTIIELCAIHRLTNSQKKRKNKYEKELYKLETRLFYIRDQLDNFAEQIPNKLKINIKEYEEKINKKRSDYIKTTQGSD